LRIALLHLAPIAAAVAENRQMVEDAVEDAAAAGADWIVTPELVTTGYTFADQIGTDWILPQPDPWMARICSLAARLRVTVFLAHPERDSARGSLHNSVFVIASDGKILGSHRKINALRVGSEAWSTPGCAADVVTVPPLGPIGLLICADAHSPGISAALKANGARLLVSPASWAPGFHGPEGIWERVTADTGLPLIVCNRTGKDTTLDFCAAESVVAVGGKRLISVSRASGAILMFDWDAPRNALAAPLTRTIELRRR
jgi:predicted amidohydrolase